MFDYARNILSPLFFRSRPFPTCVILYYHDVSNVQRDKFARQMDHLLCSAIPISLDQIASFHNGKHCAAVTFDDGFLSAIENALPELESRKIPATIFIPTAYLGQRPGWIKDCAHHAFNEMVMNADQVRQAGSNALFTISSHCRTHTRLLALKDEDAKNEIFESKKDLEKILGAEVSLLSFPHGSYNQTHIAWAREAGYERVFTIRPASLDSATDAYVIGRTKVDPSDWPLEFRLKLSGAYRWLPTAFCLKSKLLQIVTNNAVK